jgi:hypothetical protein
MVEVTLRRLKNVGAVGAAGRPVAGGSAVGGDPA